MWKLVKYEQVYLHAYEPVAEARASITHTWVAATDLGLHSSLSRETSDETKAMVLPTVELAACELAIFDLQT
jgi:hypothetical protein